MEKEQLTRWLDYRKKGLLPSRYKLRTTVYSNIGLQINEEIKLKNFTVKISPIEKTISDHIDIENLSPSFVCEVVYSAQFHKGDNTITYLVLNKILPLMDMKYRLPMNYRIWEEYEGKWLEAPNPSARSFGQTIYEELPNKRIRELTEAYDFFEDRPEKRSKKIMSIRERLLEAIETEKISRRFSFISYYNVLEIISDDLASWNGIESKNKIANDILKFKLSAKGSQRTKIYFLFNFFDAEDVFNIEKSVILADIRNDIAHGELTVKYEDFILCKKIALWISERYVLFCHEDYLSRYSTK